MGISRYLEDLIRGLGKIDDNNQYYLYYQQFSYPGNVKKLIHRDNFHFVKNSLPGKITRIFEKTLQISAFEYYTIRKAGKLDCLHGPNNYLITKHTPGVVTILDLLPLIKNDWFLPGYAESFKQNISASLKCAQAVITPSHNSKKDLLRFFDYPEKNIRVIYPGINSDRFQKPPSPSDIQKMRLKYKLPKDFILFLNTISPRKNTTRFIEAYSLIAKNFPNISLVVAGKNGWMYQEVYQKTEELKLKNRVSFPGLINEEDIPKLYKMAAIFVYPSLYEGFGFPPLEAMAAGIPVICSNTSSLPEIVEEAGLLFDPLNVDELADKMKSLLNQKDLREKLTLAGFERVKQFSLTKAAKETLDIYTQIASAV